MYIIKTKESINKSIPDLTQGEIEEAIKFNNIKKRQKKEQIKSAQKELKKLCTTEQQLQLKILDLAEQLDGVQRNIAGKTKFIDHETYKQTTIEDILSVLSKEYDSKKHFREFVFDKVEALQIFDVPPGKEDNETDE